MTRNAGLQLHVDHGPNSKHLLHLISLGQTSPLDTPTVTRGGLYSDVFPLWQTPGTWLTDSERDAFLHQDELEVPLLETSEDINELTTPLLFYIGPCEVDRLLRAVFFETIAAEPLPWLLSIPVNAWRLLLPQLVIGEFSVNVIPSAGSLEYEAGSGLLGFQRAFGGLDHFTGQWVWRPGIALFTLLWAPLNSLRLFGIPGIDLGAVHAAASLHSDRLPVAAIQSRDRHD